jgi:hypothetical protein
MIVMRSLDAKGNAKQQVCISREQNLRFRIELRFETIFVSSLVCDGTLIVNSYRVDVIYFCTIIYVCILK